MLELLRKHTYFTLPSILAGVGYFLLAFFIPRENTLLLLTTFLFLFIIAWFQFTKVESEIEFKSLIKAAFLFRLIFLFSIPMLSDDYFRFIWDGRLLAHGMNPFGEIPRHISGTALATQAGLAPELFSGMNSPDYYSIYPPVLQFIFGISGLLFPGSIIGSVVVMRLFILAAEAGSAWLIFRLLKHFHLPEKNALLYLLNPLVIVELTGNLHFEAVMIFFLLLSVYLLVTGKENLSTGTFALAVCSKLLPLIFLPLLVRFLGWKKTILYSLMTFLIAGCMFIPFFGEQPLQHFLSSTNLYFQKFEFNASIFYLVRWIGFSTNGFDIIQTAGPVLSFIVLLLTLSIALWPRKNNYFLLVELMLIVLTIYFLFATIVHPWYLTTLVALSLFTRFRFPVIWSGLILLSYFAYQSANYHEVPIALAIEYLAVAGLFVWELTRNYLKKKTLTPPLQGTGG